MRRRASTDVTAFKPDRWVAPETPIRVCLIGAGKMGAAHLAVLRTLAGVSVTAVASRRLESARRLSTLVEAEPFDDWQEMLRVCGPDGVVVAVSHEVATELYRSVLAFGIPVLLEKPAGVVAAETQDLARIAQSCDSIAMVGVNRRFYSTILQATAEVLRRGPIHGMAIEIHEPLHSLRSRLEFPAEIYDNWLVQNSIHALDLLTMCGGGAELIDLKCSREAEPIVDHFEAVAALETGGAATVSAHFSSAGGIGVRLHGAGVTADLVPLARSHLSFADGRRIAIPPHQVDTAFKPGLWLQDTCFLRGILKGELLWPASDLQDHLTTVSFIESVQRRVADARSLTGTQR